VEGGRPGEELDSVDKVGDAISPHFMLLGSSWAWPKVTIAPREKDTLSPWERFSGGLNPGLARVKARRDPGQTHGAPLPSPRSGPGIMNGDALKRAARCTDTEHGPAEPDAPELARDTGGWWNSSTMSARGSSAH
ncbi:unnamed protein product, partial [Pleuronectes platessa]